MNMERWHWRMIGLNAIADQFNASGRYPSYAAAVTAAAGVVQYQDALAAGVVASPNPS